MLLAAIGARSVQTWYFKDYERQFKFAATWQLLLVAVPALIAWFLLFSRLPWRTRWMGLASLVVAAGLTASLVRFRGINGDRVPVVEWRWAVPAHLETPTPASMVPAPAGSGGRIQGVVDFPQFQGPARDGILSDLNLGTNWDTTPPELLWRRSVGEGWSGFSVSGGLAVTMEQEDDNEAVLALDLRTGHRVWSRGYPARYADSSAGNGPRSTPTVSGGRVYACGATGILTCLELETGRPLWTVDLMKEHGAHVPEWGYSASPLVADGLVWVPAGGPHRSLVGHDAVTGHFRFGGGDSAAGYASPMRVRWGGRWQILNFNEVGVAGHDATDGRLLWEQPIPMAPHVAAPVAVGTNRLVVSTGYGKGTFLIEVGVGTDGTWTPVVVWKSIRLKSKFSNLIPRGDVLYGLDDGALVALDLASGSLRWKGQRFGHSQLLWAGDRLLVSAEDGEVALVDARPEGMTETTRFRALKDKTWNPPALAGNLLLLRNDREAVCHRMPTR